MMSGRPTMKVPLTSLQIKEICDLIPLNKAIPSVIANNIRNRILQPLIEQLKTIKIYPDLFVPLRDQIIRSYYTTLVAPGEAVGIQMAQSIGERATQQTLNSFHSSGLSIKTVTQGVPRFSELLSATKAPKMVNCIIYLTKDYTSSTSSGNTSNGGMQELIQDVGTSLTEVRIKKIIRQSSYCYKDTVEGWHHLFWNTFNDGADLPLDRLGWRVRLEFNKELLFEYKVSMEDICKRIRAEYVDVFVLYTPEYIGIVDIFINKNILPLPLSSEQLDEWDVSEELAEHYNYFDNKVLPSLYDLLIHGVEGIKEIFFEKRELPTPEWIITTEGSNLYGLFTLPGVDATKTLCNNMWEINETLGIEATRQFLMEEFTDVVSSDGTFVNPAHIQLLVDAMVFYGTIISISRYGARKMESGAISNASFEQSLETLTGAGLKGESETINGVSASILLGKMPRVGTGIVELMVDIEKLIEKDDEKKTVQFQPTVKDQVIESIPSEDSYTTSSYCMEEDEDEEAKWIQEFKTIL